MAAARHIIKALFCSFDDGLRRAFWHDATFDEAITALRDKIAALERCRDRGVDPKKY